MVKKRHSESLSKAIKEGKADERVIPFLKKIAETQNFFTSSSCCGRILLLGLKGKGLKKDSYFHFKKHRTVSFKEIWGSLQKKSIGVLWFKIEPFILHIGAKNLENTERILKVMKESGIKRGGIIVTKKGKFLTELLGTQMLSVPVKEKNKILIEKKFLKYLIKIANKKLIENYNLLKKFEEQCLKEFD